MATDISKVAGKIRITEGSNDPVFLPPQRFEYGFYNTNTLRLSSFFNGDYEIPLTSLTVAGVPQATKTDALTALEAVFPDGGSGGAVSSVFGRTGAVTAQAGDYAAFYWGLSGTSTLTGTATVDIGTNTLNFQGGSGAGFNLTFDNGTQNSFFNQSPTAFQFGTVLNDETAGALISISNTGIVFTLDGTSTVRYAADYSANYTARSLIDRGFLTVSNLLSAGGTNTIDNAAFAQEWQWNTLAGASGLKLSSTSTASASNAQKLLEISLSGANVTATQTTYGLDISNTHTGSTSSNIALRLAASGGTNNYALVTSAGTVGINTLTPDAFVSSPGDVKLQLASNMAWVSGGSLKAYTNGVDGDFSMVMRNGSFANAIIINTNGDSYFNGGKLGVGVTSPTANLHLKAGTTATSTAPLKFTAGTLLTTPEFGTMECTDDGTTGHLYVTLRVATVVTRLQLA